MAEDIKLKYTMLSALLIGAMMATLAMLAVSVPLGSGYKEAPSALQPKTVRVALNLGSAMKARSDRAKQQAAIEEKRNSVGLIETVPLPKVTPAAFSAAVQTGNGKALGVSASGQFHKVAIIIDDLGHSPRHNRGALSLPPQVAFALLPYPRYSKSLADRASRAGHELIVHMPMEPKSAGTNPGPHFLKAGLNEAELRKTIIWNLDQFGGYYAVNNHMGSRFTEDKTAMRVLFEELAARGLAFYDSRTTAASSSVELAADLGVALAERDVFLDNEREAVAVDRQLRTLERLARRNGNAIAIGHPHDVTYDQINIWAQTLEARGFKLVKPSEILADRRTPYWRRMIKLAQEPGTQSADIQTR